MQLTSNAFPEGERIPDRFTCQGEDISPLLQWTATPDAAGSGHGDHRYQLRLLALSVKSLSVSSRASCEDIEAEARKHMIAEATLTGTYSRA